jgi:NhaP-type Na+/H+ or K+/H+ antiporter
MHEGQLIGLAAVVVLAVGGQVLATRLRAPSILVLLVIGIVVGPVTGWLDPDALLGDLLFPVVALSVAIILFEGGLLLDFAELRGDASSVVRRLLVVGVPVTALSGALVGRILLDLSAPIAALLAAALTVSGPTVVLPLLRFIRPAEQVEVVLKWEGIFVDALGAALTVIAFDAILATGRAPEPWEAVLQVVVTLAAGGLVGTIGAYLLVLVLASDLVDSRIEPAVTVMLVLAAFVAADMVRAESGLFSAIVMGVVLANQRRIEVGRIEEFKETLGMLLTGALFILLSARLDRDGLVEEIPAALLLTAVLVLVVRPLATALSTAGSRFSWRERAFIAWMAPRGIVAAATVSVFAFRLEESDIADVERLVPLTFLVILMTVAVYGLTGQPMARLLGVSGGTEHEEEEGDDRERADQAAATGAGRGERAAPEEELELLDADRAAAPAGRDGASASSSSGDQRATVAMGDRPTDMDDGGTDEAGREGSGKGESSNGRPAAGNGRDRPEKKSGPASAKDAAKDAAKDVATGLGMRDRDQDGPAEQGAADDDDAGREGDGEDVSVEPDDVTR